MAGLTIPYQIPVVNVPPGMGSPIFPRYTVANGQTVNDGDFVILSGGEIEPSGNNPSGSLVGIAQHNYQDVFQQLVTSDQGVFGADNVNSGLLPASPGQTMVGLIAPSYLVAINLSQTTGWISGGSQQASIGTQVGLTKDSTTGFYYADPTASNKVAQVAQKVEGPTTTLNNTLTAQPLGFGGLGDLGARVYIQFFASALAVLGGV